MGTTQLQNQKKLCHLLIKKMFLTVKFLIGQVFHNRTGIRFIDISMNNVLFLNNVALSPSLLYNIGDYLSEDT